MLTEKQLCQRMIDKARQNLYATNPTTNPEKFDELRTVIATLQNVLNNLS